MGISPVDLSINIKELEFVAKEKLIVTLCWTLENKATINDPSKCFPTHSGNINNLVHK